jgi:hypothetical protein
MPEPIANIYISYSSREIKRDPRGQAVQVRLDKVAEDFSKEASYYTLRLFQTWLAPNGKYNVGYKGRAAKALYVSQIPMGSKKSWAVLEKPTPSGTAIKEGRMGNPNKWWKKPKELNPNRGRYKGGKVKRTNTFNYGPNTFLGRIQGWIRARGLSHFIADDGKKKNSKRMLRDATFRVARELVTYGASGDYSKRGLPFTSRRGRGVFDYPSYFSSHLSAYHMDKIYKNGPYTEQVVDIMNDAAIDHLDSWFKNIHRTGYYKKAIMSSWSTN